ncbi:cell division GTP-binding protein [Erysipelotrichaceae bacterium]|nr:cell division GTP-binding protein [Erysipelotrichaceae bacterium]
MKIKHAEYLRTAVYEEQFPHSDLPEIVFSGRSNVGKSSLINMMVGRKKLAYFSQKPGKTQTLNFYKLDEALMFVDIPGYGYAKVPKKQKDAFAQMIAMYFEKRAECAGVCLLLDIRHKPTQDDIQMFEFLSFYEIPLIILCTKADKISRNKLPQHLKAVRLALGITVDSDIPLIPTSAEKATGKTEAWSAILKLTDAYKQNRKQKMQIVEEEAVEE